jgi:hypothetical protein
VGGGVHDREGTHLIGDVFDALCGDLLGRAQSGRSTSVRTGIAKVASAYLAWPSTRSTSAGVTGSG